MKLEGAPNFRDLAGIRSRDGRVVRSGQIFRSENLSKLTDGDLEQLRKADVQLICDLRNGTAESIRAPLRNGHEVEFLHLNVIGDLRSEDGEFGRILRENFTAAGARETMLWSYGCMARRFAPRLSLLLDRLAMPERLPAIIHCHVGKDRTGFACAILLAALDVPYEEIERDYLATAAFAYTESALAGVAELIHELTGQVAPTEMITPIAAVDPDFLAASFAAIATEYGSVDVYLEKVGGLTREKRARLQATLLA